jgi:hypothetical protein
MRIDSSGNVGIGTTSPDKLLHLAASSGATLRLESTTTGATTGDIFGAIEFETQDSNSAGVKGKIDSYSEGAVGNAALRFFTGNTTELGERMRIDSAGLVSMTHAAGAHTGGLSIINSQAGGYGSSLTFQSERSDDNSIVSAAQIRTQGQDSWNSAASADSNLFFATALNGSLTDKMVIKHDGAVGIGETSPLGKLHIKGTDVGASPASTANQLVLEDTENGISILSNTAGAGNINFGDSDDNGKGGFIYDHSADAMRHIVDGGEAMRINSDGALLIGRTTALQSDNMLSVQGSGTGAGNAIMDVRNTASSDTCGCIALSKASTTTDSSARFIWFFANNFSTSMGAIGGNGASNVQFVTASDERLKENIKPLTGSLDKVLALNPVSYTWKESGEDIKAGFVAQEVEKILPEYTATEEDEMKTKSLTGGMTAGYIAVLTKAIQEQQEQIDALQSEINELKNS